MFSLVKKNTILLFYQMTHFYSLALRIFFHFLISMNQEKYFLYRDQNWNIIDDL